MGQQQNPASAYQPGQQQMGPNSGFYGRRFSYGSPQFSMGGFGGSPWGFGGFGRGMGFGNPGQGFQGYNPMPQGMGYTPTTPVQIPGGFQPKPAYDFGPQAPAPSGNAYDFGPFPNQAQPPQAPQAGAGQKDPWGNLINMLNVGADPYRTQLDYWNNYQGKPGDTIRTPSGENIYWKPNGWTNAQGSGVPGPTDYNYSSWWGAKGA